MKLSYSFLSLLQVCQNVSKLAASVVACTALRLPVTANSFLTHCAHISRIIGKKSVRWIWWWTLKILFLLLLLLLINIKNLSAYNIVTGWLSHTSKTAQIVLLREFDRANWLCSLFLNSHHVTPFYLTPSSSPEPIQTNTVYDECEYRYYNIHTHHNIGIRTTVYKKLSYCWETVRRESMPRIAKIDVKMTT